jgi:hypothetical protein
MPDNKSGPCVHCGQNWGRHSICGNFCPLPEFYYAGVPKVGEEPLDGPFFDFTHQFTTAETQKFYDNLEIYDDDNKKTMGEFIADKQKSGEI